MTTVTSIYIISTLLLPCLGLRCFQCGHYIAPEAPFLPPTKDGPPPGKIIPCENMTLDHIKECKPHELSCMKYINKGYEVRLCSDHCVDDVNFYSEREIHCCHDDACNGQDRISLPTITSLFLSLVFSFAMTLILY